MNIDIPELYSSDCFKRVCCSELWSPRASIATGYLQRSLAQSAVDSAQCHLQDSSLGRMTVLRDGRGNFLLLNTETNEILRCAQDDGQSWWKAEISPRGKIQVTDPIALRSSKFYSYCIPTNRKSQLINNR